MEGGFTLIELLIVIVVLGILAAVVVFALGGVTGKSTIAACKADGATLSTALAAFNAENPSYIGTTTYAPTLLTNTSLGGPYIQSWPVNQPHYAFGITTGGQLVINLKPGTTALSPDPSTTAEALTAGTASASTNAYYAYTGPSVCNSVSN